MAKEGVRKRIREMARERLGYEELRPGQEDAMAAVLSAHDTLAVLPTGTGKSAIYKIAGALLDGPTVVDSPLIALQTDQGAALTLEDLGDAARVDSAVGRRDSNEALDRAGEGDLEFLFLAPEQFRRPETLERVRAAKPSLFVVDEAHCISEWGHDFRPDYLRLGAVIEALGHPAVLALTATASLRVRDEILERFAMREPQCVVTGFDRPNIHLSVRHFHDEAAKRRALLECVQTADKPGIVYVATRRHAEELAEDLNARGVGAIAYHAGMKHSDRDAAQAAFMGDGCEVIVATNAFGMGIDKPDVRFVYHYDVPDSIDAYDQEIGRAGPDGEPALALLFYRPQAWACTASSPVAARWMRATWPPSLPRWRSGRRRFGPKSWRGKPACRAPRPTRPLTTRRGRALWHWSRPARSPSHRTARRWSGSSRRRTAPRRSGGATPSGAWSGWSATRGRASAAATSCSRFSARRWRRRAVSATRETGSGARPPSGRSRRTAACATRLLARAASSTWRVTVSPRNSVKAGTKTLGLGLVLDEGLLEVLAD